MLHEEKRVNLILPLEFFFTEMEVSVVETDGFSGYTFPDQSSQLNVNESIKLPSAIFKGSSAGEALLSFQTFILSRSVFLIGGSLGCSSIKSYSVDIDNRFSRNITVHAKS